MEADVDNDQIASLYSRADRPDVTIDFDVHYFKS